MKHTIGKSNCSILQTRLQKITWSHILKVLRVEDATAQIPNAA